MEQHKSYIEEIKLGKKNCNSNIDLSIDSDLLRISINWERVGRDDKYNILE